MRRSVVDPTYKRSVYVNKDGEHITHDAWKALRANPEYVTIREFENGKLYVAVLWLGEIADAKSVPPEHWKLYGVTVMNIMTHDVDGHKYPKPVRVRDPELCQRYRTEREAIDVYEDVLVRYAGCEWIESASNPGEHHFIEKGNKLAPPPPDAPRAGEMSIDEALIGSW